MPTYSDGIGFNKNDGGYPHNISPKAHMMKVELDIADIVAARAAASATALADGDVLEVIDIPAKCAVLAAGIDVTEAGDASLTAAVGDGADPDGYVAALAADAVGSDCSVSSTLTEAAPNTFDTAYAVGKYYAAADTIDVLLAGATPTTGVMTVWALVLDCEFNPS